VDIVGEHQRDVHAALAAEHRVAAADATREQRHAFVLSRRAVQRPQPEAQEILGLDHLRQDAGAVVSRVGGIVAVAAVVLAKAHETRILDAALLAGRSGKDHALGQPY
jgi:hypothetical protein